MGFFRQRWLIGAMESDVGLRAIGSRVLYMVKDSDVLEWDSVGGDREMSTQK